MKLTRKQTWYAGAGAVAAALAVGLLWNHNRPARIDALMVSPSTGAPGLAGGLRQDIIGDLARAPGLPLVSGPAERPGITGVLEVQAERSADRIRVTVELHRSDGHRFWTRTFDRAVTDLPSLAGEIAGAINPKVRKHGPRHKPVPAAYEAYLQAREDFDHPDNSRLQEAATRLEDATRKDPDFALAWAWLSIAREYQADCGQGKPNAMLPEARAAADRATALDPGLGEAHLALGIDYLQYDWQWSDAKRELDRAAQLSPGSALVGYWRERWNAAMGHGAEPQFHFANLPAIHGPDDVRKLLSDAEDIRVETYISAAALALLACQVHDPETAMYWLNIAYQERCVHLPYVVWNPELPRSDPRFADLLRRMHLQTGS